VSPGPRRDPDLLCDGLTAWLQETDPSSSVESIAHASAGLSNETLVVRVRQGGEDSQLVVRLAPQIPSFPDYDLSMQATVHTVVATHGIPAPTPTRFEGDSSWLGIPFLVMPYVAGQIPGPVPALDPWVAQCSTQTQQAIEQGFLDVLAAVHRIGVASEPSLHQLRGRTGGVEDELQWWAEYLEWAADPAVHPILATALRWCRQHRPEDEPPPSLLWGDPRLGNVIFDHTGAVVAVLDWELASIGPAEMDLGWYLGLDEMMRELFGQSVKGFSSHDDFVARYEVALGRPLRDLAYHEVFALTRAMAINDCQLRLRARTDEERAQAEAIGAPLLASLQARLDG
jgi:aminoglycoside phosphotransferase (APT) family kinase protein